MSELPTGAERRQGQWRTKWRWVVAYWVVQAMAVHLVFTQFFNGEAIPDFRGQWSLLVSPFWLMMNGIYIGVITAAQAVLLIPVRRPGLSTRGRGVRLVQSAAGGLAVAGLVWLAMWPAAVLIDYFGAGRFADRVMDGPLAWVGPVAVWLIVTALLWGSGKDGLPVQLSVCIAAAAAAGLLAGLIGAMWSLMAFVAGDQEWIRVLKFASMSGGLLVGWLVATPLVWSFVKRRGAEDGLARLSSRLFLGTIVEAAAVIPLDVMIRRKTSCHCEEGTFWALSLCWAIGAFALGPVVFLVPMSKRRKRWYTGRCEACGYDMSGCLSAERCPECGAGWRAREGKAGKPDEAVSGDC